MKSNIKSTLNFFFNNPQSLKVLLLETFGTFFFFFVISVGEDFLPTELEGVILC